MLSAFNIVIDEPIENVGHHKQEMKVYICL